MSIKPVYDGRESATICAQYRTSWVQLRSSKYPILELLMLLARTWELVLEEAQELLVPKDSVYSAIQKLARSCPKWEPLQTALTCMDVVAVMESWSATTLLPQVLGTIRLLRGHTKHPDTVEIISPHHAVVVSFCFKGVRMKTRTTVSKGHTIKFPAEDKEERFSASRVASHWLAVAEFLANRLMFDRCLFTRAIDEKS